MSRWGWWMAAAAVLIGAIWVSEWCAVAAFVCILQAHRSDAPARKRAAADARFARQHGPRR